MEEERVGDDGDVSVPRKRIRLESRWLSHGEELELDPTTGDAMREMSAALDDGEIVKRRGNVAPNRNETEVRNTWDEDMSTLPTKEYQWDPCRYTAD